MIKIFFNTILILLVVYLPCRSTAQNAVFIMNSVNILPGTTTNATAVNFKSLSACINVYTGIDVLIERNGIGQFDPNCAITLKINSLGVKLFPNPVSDNSKVRILMMPPVDEIFNVSIWTTDGVLLASRKENGYNLYQGVNLGTNNLHSGTFIAKIESSNFIDVIKFVKSN